MNDRWDAEDVAPVDPVALTLAVWLGLIVGVMALLRMSENAAMQAAQAQANAPPGVAAEMANPFSTRLMAFGG
jgi:hypothetical protein